jgi:hypothetical protein
MNGSVDDLEQRLLAGYRQQLQNYENAWLVLVGRVPTDGQTHAPSDWLPRLQDPLQRVADLDRAMAHDKAVWQQNAGKPGRELSAVLDQLAEKIRVLKEAIDAEVADLLVRKQRLLPVMDDFIRQRWMLNAYGQTSEPRTK